MISLIALQALSLPHKPFCPSNNAPKTHFKGVLACKNTQKTHFVTLLPVAICERELAVFNSAACAYNHTLGHAPAFGFSALAMLVRTARAPGGTDLVPILIAPEAQRRGDCPLPGGKI